LAYAQSHSNCKLILSARNVENLLLVKAKCKDAKVAVLPFDLADFNSARNHAEKAISFFGKIDILINNGE
jgi:NADP-dependent 3-hydroxy acid dehydrogenase YdfG